MPSKDKSAKIKEIVTDACLFLDNYQGIRFWEKEDAFNVLMQVDMVSSYGAYNFVRDIIKNYSYPKIISSFLYEICEVMAE